MDMNEGGPDRLDTLDQERLRASMTADFPSHAFELHANGEGLNWVVFEPGDGRPDLLRFTICRLDPSVMVLIEDHDARRQYRSATSIDHAVRLMRDLAGQTLMGIPTPYPAPRVTQ